MRIGLWILVAVCLPGLVAAEWQPNDFAYGISIDVPQGTAVAALSLPEQVYTNAFRSDLGDMRVFNAAGEPVPHMIRYTQSRAVESPWRSLSFYPLAEAKGTESSGYRVYVRTGPDGAIVTVDPRIAALPNAAAKSYLIDVSGVHSGLAQLRLEWQPMAANWLANVTVEASDDLTSWSAIQPRASLADIGYASRRLVRNVVPLRHTSKRYLRLRQLDSAAAVTLVGIQGRARTEGRRPVRTVLRIDGTRPTGPAGVFNYEISGGFPVDRVNLVFQQANSMADAVVESRAGVHLPWVQRTKGLFYRIESDAATLVSDPLAIRMTLDRFWQVTVDASESTIGKEIPQLEIGYRPHDLFFIARGGGPFTLAYGSARVEPSKVKVGALFKGIGKHRPDGLERWVTGDGPPMLLGGLQRLAPPPQPLPKRRIILWSILLAGVLVVAALAWRLARKMSMGG